MVDSNRSVFSSLPVRIVGSLAAIGVVAALMLKPNDNGDGGNGKLPGEVDPVDVVEENADSRCDKELSRILSALQPGRRSVTMTSQDLAAELNRWFQTCGISEDLVLTEDAELQKKLMSEEGFEIAESDRYLPIDIDHIRLAMLLKKITDHVCRNATTDSERALVLLEFVTRYVSLIPEDLQSSIDFPSTPYESLLIGYSNAEGRAWTFSALLQQLRLDSVVIVPADEAKSDQWLVGVLVPQKGLQLFDPRLGLPIPGPNDSKSKPFPTSAATLAQVQEDDSLLRQLDSGDQSYPLVSADLKDVRIKVIGSPILWSQRMAELQWALPADSIVDLYDGLGSNRLREPGAFERIVAAGEKDGHWTEDQIEIWNAPTEQLIAVSEAQRDENSPYSKILEVFAGPQVMMASHNSPTPILKPLEYPLHVVRLELLDGEYGPALQHIGRILTSYRTNSTPENDDAIAFAAMWTGIAQTETKNFTAARNTFDRFATTIRSPQSPAILLDVLDQTATDWKAYLFVEMKDFAEAANVLSSKPDTASPLRDAFLERRWKQLAEKSDSGSVDQE
ncbi:hypothetical protein KOR42_24290 [Thalassoglobus neptunius]|uniref:Transglutaminase-like superfamily protein n=1 Tax=Thalassoglobus neptunius TaxID=1938619 RepID=A0A5C5X7Z7_9PLAN|nr:hypothetical protein [Thalassoglobus neptunius]TWT59040.1 hypothetical protein KOR42_24290 [Thalassoglobus neptunius]